MLEAIIAGQDDPQTLAQYAQGRMRARVADLERALVGRVRDSHRLLLRLHLEHSDDLNAKIARLETEIDRCLAPFDQDALVARLCTIPGVNRRIATILIAEIGVDSGDCLLHHPTRHRLYRSEPNYFDKRDAQAVRQRLTRRLEALGFKVILEPLPAAA